MVAQQLALSEHDVAASICRDSFFDFVQEFWEEIIQEKPVWNWHIPYLCDELQTVAERVFDDKPKEYDLIVNIPPGTTKSTVCSVMFPAWVWTRMPSARVLSSSYSHDLALDLSRKSRDIITSEKYSSYYPEIALRSDQNTKGHYINNRKGFRKAVGTGTMVTGFHGHFLITDDPVDPRAAISEAKLKDVNSWMAETWSTRKVDKEVSVQILIMQRLHQDDPTGNRLEKIREGDTVGGKVKHICLPGEDSYPIKPARLKKYYINGLLDPKRLTRRVMEDVRKLMGIYGYAGQIGQQPVPPGGGMFRVARLHIATPPHRRNFRKIIRYWDKASTEDAGCYTVGVLMGLDEQERWWVLDVQRGQWETNERERVIQNTAKMDGYEVTIGLEEEGGSGGKDSARMTIRKLAGYKIKVDRPKGDKLKRAEPFADQVNGENVWLAQGAWNPDYINEMRFFSDRAKYKDQIDASSGAFSLLVNATRVGTFKRKKKLGAR